MQTYNELKAMTGWYLMDPDGSFDCYEPIDIEASTRKVWRWLGKDKLVNFAANNYQDEQTMWAVMDYFSMHEPITEGN